MKKALYFVLLMYLAMVNAVAQEWDPNTVIVDSLTTQSHLLDLLTGRIPGVHITATDGMPCSEPGVVIRGRNDLISNSALTLIDGVPYFGSLSLINPQDIESITVLKDVAGILSYEPNASGGIISIRLKKGSSEGWAVSVKWDSGIVARQGPDYKTADLPQYLQYWWQAYYNRHLLSSGTAPNGNDISQWLLTDYMKINPFDRPITQVFDPKDGTVNPAAGLLWGEDLDWRKQLERIGLRHDGLVTIEGGWKKANLRGSVGITDEDSYAVGIGGHRYTTSLFSQASPLRNLRISASFQGAVSRNTGPVDIQTSRDSEVDPFTFVRMIGNIYPVHQHAEDGSYMLSNEERQLDFGFVTDQNGYIRTSRNLYQNYNAIESLKKWQEDYDEEKMGQGLVSLSWEPIPDLLFEVTGNGLLSNSRRSFARGIDGNYEYCYNTDETDLCVKETVRYRKTVGDHHFGVRAEHRSFSYETYQEFQLLNHYENSTLRDTTKTDTFYEDWFLNADYVFKGKYAFSLNYRQLSRNRTEENTSIFPAGTHTSSQPGLPTYGGSVSWMIDRENFCAAIPWLDKARIRISCGKMSNQGRGYFGEWNAGLDFGLAKRVVGSVCYFDRLTTDTLFFINPIEVEPTFRNRGLETSLNVLLLKTSDLSLSFSGNLSYIHNHIMKLPDGKIKSGNVIYQENHSLAEFYLPLWLGVDPATGRSIYKAIPPEDPNYESYASGGNYHLVNGVMCTTKPTYAQYEYCGPSAPPVVGGFGTTFKFRSLSFVLDGYFQLGGKIYDWVYSQLMSTNSSTMHRLHADLADSWKKPGDQTSVSQLDTGNATNTSNSSRWLVSSDMLELTRACLSYDISGWQKGIRGITLYVSANNFLMISARQGLFPRMVSYGTTFISGKVPSRTVSLGVRMNLN